MPEEWRKGKDARGFKSEESLDARRRDRKFFPHRVGCVAEAVGRLSREFEMSGETAALI